MKLLSARLLLIWGRVLLTVSIPLCTQAISTDCSHFQLLLVELTKLLRWETVLHVDWGSTQKNAGELLGFWLEALLGHSSTSIESPTFYPGVNTALSRRTSGRGCQWDIIQMEKSMTLAFAFAWHRQASLSPLILFYFGTRGPLPILVGQSEAIHLASNTASSWSATTWTSFWNRDLLLMHVNSLGAPQWLADVAAS